MLDFCCRHVKICLGECRILIVWTLDFSCVDVGFDLVNVGIWLCGRWILVAWMFDFSCMDVGF